MTHMLPKNIHYSSV